MRYYLILFLVVISSCRLANTEKEIGTEIIQNPVTPEGLNDDLLAEIAFDQREIDFGRITQGEKITLTFEFENRGNGPLIISGVKPSCGCTLTKDWPKEPIEPGDEEILEIEFNSQNKIGFTSSEIVVSSNTLPSSTILIIKGEVVGPSR